MAVKKAKEVEVQIEEVVETPVVEVVAEPEVEVVAQPVKAKRPEGTAKICMRVDHKCTIAKEVYDLKKGKVYTVPENVKRILNEAGLLAPLP